MTPGSFGHWRKDLLAELAVGIVLAAIALATLAWQAEDQGFSVDESRWISTSRYFWITFVERDLFGEEWQPGYIVMTHPPVARYVIGLGLALQGWQPDQLNGRFDGDRNREWNERAGNVPGPELLADARRAVFPFAVGVVVLLYFIGRAVGGPVAGVVTVLLTVFNPLLATAWTRALAESVLAFFTLAGVLLTMWVAPRFLTMTRQVVGTAALGLALGLATATKLSGALTATGLGLFAVLQVVAARRAGQRWSGLWRWCDVALIATIAFIIVNPLLYPSPIVRTYELFEHRQLEMEYQGIMTPRQAVPPNLLTRAGIVFRRTFLEFGTFQEYLGLPLDPPLTLLGFGVVVVATWRALRSRALVGPRTVLACWAVMTYAISIAALGFNSSHYFAPTVAVAVVLKGLGLSEIVAVVRWRWRARIGARVPSLAGQS